MKMHRQTLFQSLAFGLTIAASCHTAALGGDDSWVQTWNPETGTDALGGHMIVDNDGNTYAVMLATDASGLTDIAALKYDTEGVLLWEFIYDAPTTESDSASSVALTAEGIAIVGTSPDAGGPQTILLEVSSDGTLIRERRMIGPTFAGFLSPKIVIDSQQRRIIGTDDGAGNGTITAYDHNGNLVFETPLAFEGFSGISAVEVTSTDQIVVVTVEMVGGGGSYVTRLFDSNGQEQWAQIQSAPTGLVLSEAHIVVTEDDKIIVSGTPEGSCHTPIARVWQYDIDGNLLWLTEPGDDPCDFALVVGMAASPLGGVIVAADRAPQSQLVHLDADGNIVWEQFSDRPTVDTSYRGVVVTETNQIVAAGLESPVDDLLELDIRIDRYSINGQLTDTTLYAGMNDARDSFGSMAAALGGEVVVGATTIPDAAAYQAVTIHTQFGDFSFADLNQDGVVDTIDLLTMLSSWGPCKGCPADIDGNGFVETVDLLVLLSQWTG